MTATAAPALKNRLDYTEPDFFIRAVELEFDIRDGETFVALKMAVERNGAHTRPLVLDGNKLDTISVAVDGNALAPALGYQTTDNTLTLDTADARFTLETKVRIKPEDNTELAGLYKSNGMWCTQCEATDFRNITWFIDRPDNMASYKVKVIADKTSPVLLSNGNLVDQGNTPDGRHYTVWSDPAPKPSYLFALVAGDLDHIEDKFTTMSGRDVTLRIYAESKDKEKLDFAMDSLKRSMRWDEVNYGREYELDLFNIVAVDYFNMGAMENRSLNIFNTAYVLAHQKSQSDAAFAGVEGVIAHEFFHHWTGNNVTLRDWPELTLKEGLTVFRDQSFSSDMGSAAINRIENVQALRASQFKEDSGPLAHPIRPDTYANINNFYTSTIYNKGAEVIGMIKTIIGADTYRAATDLYFQRFTGKAVSCDDFVQCMEDSSGYDMTQFKLWYSQAGTPTVDASWTHDAATNQLTLTLKQTVPPTPGQPVKQDMVIPVRVGVICPDGKNIDLTVNGGDKVLILDSAQQSFTFDNIPSGSVPSLLRNFSAPVVLNAAYTDDERRHLMVHDTDGFNQWEVGHQLILQEMLVQVDNAKAGKAVTVNPDIVDALRSMINRPGMDSQLLALMLDLPGYTELAQKSAPINPAALLTVQDVFNTALRTELAAELLATYHANNAATPWTYDLASVSRRAIKNTALYCLTPDESAKDPALTALAVQQYQAADNMTDRGSALHSLLRTDYKSVEAQAALDDFYQTFKGDDLPINAWFGMKVAYAGKDAAQAATAIFAHPDFQNPSPNRTRAVLGAVCGTREAFHAIDGSGYQFMADQILALDSKNSQTAARFVDPFADFAQYAQPWQDQMKATLVNLASQPKLSSDVDDKLRRILGNDYPLKAAGPGGTAPALTTP